MAFHQRISEPGEALILQVSIRINNLLKDNNDGDIVSIDTTVQKKNIFYPTDDKFCKKIIVKCWIIADKESIDLHQPYTQTVKKLKNIQCIKRTQHGAEAAKKNNKSILIVAGRLVRELGRELPLARLGAYLPTLKLYQRVLSKKRGDSDKIYRFHEPDVNCYSKGKEHKKFEFGSKVFIIISQSTGIIMGGINFTQTLHDSKTIPEVMEQFLRLSGR